MVQCACGKVIDKVPSWLSVVQVEFVCNNCPKRQLKKITQVQLETPVERVTTEVPVVDEFDEDVDGD